MQQKDKQSDIEWAEKQISNFIDIRPRFEEYAKVLSTVLEKVAKKYAHLAIVQARPKAVPSFAEKIQRKRSLYNDALKDMTDLCGARVITHTQTEVDAVCRYIEDHFEIDWENSCDVCQRLKPSEFGYLSVHYIVQFKPGEFPNEEVPVTVPESVMGLKAEIQVRTFLQHSWADISHDLSYKSEIRLPSKWQRQFATLAASLEEADRAFCRIEEGLNIYRASYGAYMTESQIRDEIGKQEFVLGYDRDNVDLAAKIGKMAISLGDWDKAIQVLSDYAEMKHQAVLRDLGVAICKKHREHPESKEYKKGQGHLEAAAALPDVDADTLASLAGTWKGIDESKVRQLYRSAFEIDPTDPYPLVNYLDCEVVCHQNIDLVPMIKPVIDAAMQKSREHADVGINLPWAFYNIGKFLLIQGKAYESLTAYAKALHLSTAMFMIESSVKSQEKLALVKDSLPGIEWILRFLLIGLVAKFGDKADPVHAERLSRLGTEGAKPIRGPVVILSGGCSADVEDKVRGYRDVLLQAFRGFAGTIISGGTNCGVNGLAGEIQKELGEEIETIGYLPEVLPENHSPNSQLHEIRRYPGTNDFSPMETAQYWIDILNSGIDPRQVRMLGINGGTIAATEFRMALAFGASVGILEDSGREATRLLGDEDWCRASTLFPLPEDPMTLRAFFGTPKSKLPKHIRDVLSKAVHEEYQRNQEKEIRSKEPSMAEWDDLDEVLKDSSRQQVDDMLAKLTVINCDVVEVTNRDVAIMTFTDEEVEMLSEIEHGRWTIERLGNGWRRGEQKDVDKRITPYLVSWQVLPERVREWDRQAVRVIPRLLSKVNLEIRRK